MLRTISVIIMLVMIIAVIYIKTKDRMQFIGRTNELQALATAFDGAARGPSRMTVVTGRRRVGKTTLIRESIKGKPSVTWFMTAATEKDLVARLTQVTITALGPIVPEGLTSFAGLFEVLMQYAQYHHFSLVMDEFQNLAKVNPHLFSRIQDIWDSNKDRTHMHLILSGSSYSMMKKIFEDDREPLFGRATTKIHLQPFAADELISLARELPKKITNDDLLALYTITGGVALYVADFIDNGVFQKEKMFAWTVRPGSLFLSEGYDLLRLEVDGNQSTYISILRALAHGQTQAPRIADLIGVTPLNSYLERLEMYGFVEKMRPILAKPNSRSVRWQICDPFLRFWFRFIEGNQNLIENGMSSVLAQDISAAYETFSGPMLERFFRQKLMRTGKYIAVGSWWKQERGTRGDQNEVDIIAIGRNKKSAFVAEVKRQKKSFREGIFLDKVENLKKSVLAGYDIETACLMLDDLQLAFK